MVFKDTAGILKLGNYKYSLLGSPHYRGRSSSLQIVNQVQDDHLKELVHGLQDVLSKSRANNTIKKYATYFKRWSNWSAKFDEVVEFPAKDVHVVLFFVSLIQSGISFSVIESCFYAIKHTHNVNNQPDPTDSVLASYALEAAKRTCFKPVTKKLPITPEHIKRVYESIIEEGKMSLLSLRDFTLILLCFCGFLRFEEAANITLWDVVFNQMYMKIFIEESKTDLINIGLEPGYSLPS
ncbi:integrase/recombinase xerD homolog [Clytia hemisphaerica]|uniref:integrase/recombinase xerD homolog n=1 Tax=Clytia hemisphaerica TaxID=252671 RepID=UPI0034D5582E